MNYDAILNKIKPTKEEFSRSLKIANDIIKYLNEIPNDEGIVSKAVLVGSVAKKTFLSGQSDIDIFISFPQETSPDYLEEKGLYLAYKASEKFNGISYKNYASHPYLISEINGFKVDFVPCYQMNEGSKIKSAVDRTVLHTEYIKKNLKKHDEVLLLKRFMNKTKTYGSENKTGGFAGYLCELLIIKYGTFENLLKNASNWKYGTKIDLESYKTSNQFNDPLIVIDPTDKNRNVSAALRLDIYSKFINSARNYLESSNEDKIKYFEDLNKNISLKAIKKQFKNRGSKTLLISFEVPEIILDSLHPQLKKTLESICEKLEEEDFSVFKYDYWTNEKDLAIFLIEMTTHTLNNIKVHYGPKIFSKKACINFQKIHGIKNCYTLNDYLVKDSNRKFKTCEEYIKYVLNKKNSQDIKIGKNIKDHLIETYQINYLEDYLDNISKNNEFIQFLDDYLNPGQYQKR